MSETPKKKWRVLLDTNVYSRILESEATELLRQMRETDKLVFFGFSSIRSELKQIPKKRRLMWQSYRQLVLKLYDELVGGYSFETNATIESLAGAYGHAFRGNQSLRKLRNDFRIVACASFHQLDVLVSDDEHSMLSKHAINAYKTVNANQGWATPHFRRLRELPQLV